MKKILIPTDFSEQAYNATKAASVIAKKLKAEIILLHVLDLPQQGSDSINKGTPATEVMFFKNAAEDKLKELAHDPIFNGLTVSSSLILDTTSLGVTKSAENNKVNLIVMGSHGVSGPKEYFVGSNTEKVVRNSNIPVLVIKDAVESFNIDNFIFASDFSDGMVEPFKKALSFSRSMECKLHLLMVNTPNNFKPTHVAEEIVNNFLDSITDQDFDLSTYNDMTIEKGIINFSKKHGADLVGIATHGRTGLAHFFNGSISEDLVNHSATSVITFKID